jgi:hypothetical protein
MRTLNQIVNKLWELKDEFVEYDADDVHDNIYYQLLGIAETEDIEDDEALMKELDELVTELEKYLESLKSTPNFNWIFA